MTITHERTHEIFDEVNRPKVADETRTHIIYYCPNCIIKRGKPDNEGKLYWSVDKGLGFCFKCNTAYHRSVDSEGPTAESELEQVSRSFSNNEMINYPPDPSKVATDFSELNNICSKYLVNDRHKLLGLLASKLGFMSWKGSTNGVVIPFYYKNYCSRYQVRFITDNHKRRFHTSSGDNKIPYSPNRILGNTQVSHITICEGVFDAIALWILGFPNPLAILGSSITSYQIGLIRKLCPEKITLCMDTKLINDGVKLSFIDGLRNC